MKLALVVVLSSTAAYADRPWHGSAGAGGSLLLTGGHGDAARFDVAADVKPPGSRYGVGLAWRAFDGDHHGLVSAGVVFEAASARPRLFLDLHGEIGADLDSKRPLAGGGLRTTLAIVAPLAIQLDTGGLLVVDGVSNTRFQIYSNVLVGVRW